MSSFPVLSPIIAGKSVNAHSAPGRIALIFLTSVRCDGPGVDGDANGSDRQRCADRLSARLVCCEELFRSVDAAAVSAVSVTELISGARNDEEEAAMNELFGTAHVVGVDENIAPEAGRLRRQFFRSHNVEIADALIAATSILHRLQLVTLKRRHYPMLTDALVPYRKGA